MEGKQNLSCLHPKVKNGSLKQVKCKFLLRIQVLWDVMLCFWVCKRWWHYAMKAQRGMAVLLHSGSTLALEEEEWSMSCSCHPTTRKEPWYQLNMKLGASRGQYGYVWRWKNLCPGYESQSAAQSLYQLHYPVVRYMVPNNFKDNGTFIFMGKLTLESEDVTVLQNSGNYTTNSTVSYPKGPKSLPMPL
jgi:hypothetical protein